MKEFNLPDLPPLPDGSFPFSELPPLESLHDSPDLLNLPLPPFPPLPTENSFGYPEEHGADIQKEPIFPDLPLSQEAPVLKMKSGNSETELPDLKDFPFPPLPEFIPYEEASIELEQPSQQVATLKTEGGDLSLFPSLPISPPSGAVPVEPAHLPQQETKLPTLSANPTLDSTCSNVPRRIFDSSLPPLSPSPEAIVPEIAHPTSSRACRVKWSLAAFFLLLMIGGVWYLTERHGMNSNSEHHSFVDNKSIPSTNNQIKDVSLPSIVNEDLQISSVESVKKEKTALDWLAEGDFLLSKDSPSSSDYQQGVRCYEEAAKKHDSQALFQLGRMYLSGTGVEQSLNKSLHYFHEAALLHHHGAEFALYRMYNQGWGVTKNQNQAFSWLVRAAEEEPLAQLKLAEFYLKGIPPAKPSRQISIELIKKSMAAAPSPEAAILLGLIYYGGNDPAEHREIQKLVQPYAEQNIPQAMKLMAEMYLNQKHGYPNISSETSFTNAESWLNKLIQQGDTDAACQLGIHLWRRAAQCKGTEKQQFLNNAIEYLQLAAKAGNPTAIELLQTEVPKTTSNLLDEKQTERLLKSYVSARQNMDLNTLNTYFASEVDYQYIKGRNATHDSVMEDIQEGWNNWKNRQCIYIDGGRKNNRIELIYRFVYTSSENKTIQGYAKEKWVLDSDGKIIHWREQVSRKNIPHISSGFKKFEN